MTLLQSPKTTLATAAILNCVLATSIHAQEVVSSKELLQGVDALVVQHGWSWTKPDRAPEEDAQLRHLELGLRREGIEIREELGEDSQTILNVAMGSEIVPPDERMVRFEITLWVNQGLRVRGREDIYWTTIAEYRHFEYVRIGRDQLEGMNDMLDKVLTQFLNDWYKVNPRRRP